MIKLLMLLIVGVFSLILMLVIGLWGYYALIKVDNRVETGIAYGFSIGDSKQLSYQKVIKLIEQGELIGFDHVYPKETYDFAHIPSEVEQVASYFERWKLWILTDVDDFKSQRVDLNFTSDSLEEIRDVKNGAFIALQSWPNLVGEDSKTIRTGDSYQIVYEKLLTLSDSNPEIKIAAGSIFSYRLPNTELDKEYYRVKDFTEWKLRVSSHYFSNSITLTFNENDELIKIHRKRVAFELP